MVTCPLKDTTYNGNCEFCNFKVECMLRDILEKLQSLENTVAEMKTKLDKQTTT